MSALFLTVDYDVAVFPFQKLLAASIFRVRQLDRLHEDWSRRTGKAELSYADNLTLRNLMQRMPSDAPFYKLYHSWVARVVAPRYGGRISYSAHPKMRVHLAGTGCVSEFHCDADVTKREDQINCYLPFTDVYDSCTLWCEREYGAGDYEPLNLHYGQALIWDGGRLEHGTYANRTESTRVSCDFRFSLAHPERVRSPWSDVLAGRPVRIAPAMADPEPLSAE